MCSKVNCGFKNFYFAPYKAGLANAPIPFPGAIKLSHKPECDTVRLNVRTDKGMISNTQRVIGKGKTAALEVVSLPISFLTDILGYFYDDNNILCEGVQETMRFALLYETSNMGNPIRYCLPECICSKPTFDVSTLADSISADTRTLDIVINPYLHNDRYIYSKSITEDNNKTIFDDWFNKVY